MSRNEKMKTNIDMIVPHTGQKMWNDCNLSDLSFANCVCHAMHEKYLLTRNSTIDNASWLITKYTETQECWAKQTYLTFTQSFTGGRERVRSLQRTFFYSLRYRDKRNKANRQNKKSGKHGKFLISCYDLFNQCDSFWVKWRIREAKSVRLEH